MSVLAYLTGYGTESDESDTEVPKKKAILPTPNLSTVNLVHQEQHIDNPDEHSGRLRTFAHERGNWATFVYVKYPVEDLLEEFISQIKKELQVENCINCEDVHVSLSKTVCLKYHMIPSFTSSLKSELSSIHCFQLSFDSLKIYCNEEETRTFVALKVDLLSNQVLQQISEKVDKVLKEFSLPLFYEDPSFHASIWSVNGNRVAELEHKLSVSNLDNPLNKLTKEFVDIETVFCKIGNKLYQYALQ